MNLNIQQAVYMAHKLIRYNSSVRTQQLLTEECVHTDIQTQQTGSGETNALR